MKKAITILLILTIALFPISTYASSSTYENYAESLSNLGVFVGTGSGFELDRAPTRIEGLVMLIRLLGAENDANNLRNSKLPFTDVPKWATGYVAYAYSNDLAKGISPSKFGSNNTMEAKAFITFLLRSLGYNDSAGDFSYNSALSFSKGIGLINDSTYSTLNSSTFLRGHIAKTAYDTLKFRYKNSDTLLIDKLMGENKINSSIGNKFKETVLNEPESAVVVGSKSDVDIAKNAESIVMLNCTTTDGDAIGSGVIISSSGEIVTNYHVIEGATSISVSFNDGSQYGGDVYVQDYDKSLDLAIIKINKTGLKAVTIDDSSTVKQGESIVAIGSPYGFFNTVTDGIISAIRNNGFQISAAINPGSSGGGLFNSKGKLIGITYSGVTEADNLGFAIPVNNLQNLTDKKMLSLITFTNSTSTSTTIATIQPPGDIYIVSETYDTAYINWDPVVGADYYYFYYQKDGDTDFWYDKEANGSQMKFYHNSGFSVEYYGLQPETRYNVIITSVKNNVESADSKTYSFIKGYGDSDSNSNSNSIFYDDFNGVPDFGKVADCYPSSTGSSSYFYASNDFDSSAIAEYGYTLIDYGFTYQRSFRDSHNNLVMVYGNYSIDKTVMTGVVTLNGTPGYFIVIEDY